MPKRILIVDDDSLVLHILSSQLKNINYSVIEARNGNEALDKFKTERPDLVLLDVVLPITSGFEVLEKIKIELKSNVPVIILSNLDEPEDIETGKKLGAIDFINKSNLSLKEIIDKIHKALGQNG
jgi:DNA-binding response OmpR family regulator